MARKPVARKVVKTRNTFTDQQQRFIDAFFEYGGNINAAGIAATDGRNPGYGSVAMSNDRIREYVQQESMRRIETRLLPLTHWAVERILSDPKTPGAAVVAATKLVWETAGVGDASRRRAETDRGKEISEMTVAEMEAELQRLKDAADRRIARTAAIDLQPESESDVDEADLDPFA